MNYQLLILLMGGKNMKKKILGILTSTLLIMTIMPLVSGTEPIMSPGVIDQEQPNTSEIGWINEDIHWQSFVNKGKTLEEVQLHIGCWYGGSGPVKLFISESIGSSPLTEITYEANDLPFEQQDWFTFDVPDIVLDNNVKYYIIIEVEPGSEYGWSGAHGDPYPDGESNHPDADWDYAFRTIVDKIRPRSINLIENFPTLYQLIQKLIGHFPIIEQFLQVLLK